MTFLQNVLNNFNPVVFSGSVNEKNNMVIHQEYIDPKPYIKVEGNNNISFQLQEGAVAETGVNGVQVVDIIKFTLLLIKQLNLTEPCRENSITITKLEEAIQAQQNRSIEGVIRNVEKFLKHSMKKEG
jgi:hypothetical protein